MVIDYRALAMRLRGVHRLRAERFERERPEREADKANLSLDHALDVMQTGAAAELLRDVEQKLRKAVDDTKGIEPEPFAVGFFKVPLPDPFLNGVLGYYDDALDSNLDPRSLAQAVVTSLAKAAGAHGFIDDATARRRLGPLGAQIVAQLAAATPAIAARDGSHKSSGKYLGLDIATTQKIALSKKRDGYLERMPVVRELCAAAGDDIMRGVAMSSVQHLFPSASALYEMLFDKGLVPTDAQVGGKFYSANVNTLASMDARGMVVHMNPAWPDDGDPDAEDAVAAMAKQELEWMFRNVDPRDSGKRFMLLDDGGKLIKALHEHFPRYAHLCVAVEQTTRGIQVLDKMKKDGKPILCPVVNMAQSDIKREVESPLIAESVAWHVDHYLASLGLDSLKPTAEEPKTAVVVGFGATGSALAAALRRHGYHVVVTDKDEGKLAAARAAGFDTSERIAAFQRADLLIGATGMGAIDASEWRHVKNGAVLANAASGTHELGLRGISERQLSRLDRARTSDASGAVTTSFGGKTLTIGREGDDPRLEHKVVRVAAGREGEKELLFLRGGAVVNMEHDLPPEYRQIIVAMLLASCFQAVGETEPGPHDLDPEMQSFLRKRFAKALAAEGLSATEPDLDAVRGPWG